MKLEISTKLLRDTVARLSDITGNSIQLEATMEGLTITRSTTAVRAEITISDCSVEDESVVILDYEALKNTLSRTKGETVAIAIKGDIIFVSGESSLARLQTYDDELYKPADEERSVLAVSKASEIRDQLLATVDACSTGDDFLSNICIRRIKDRLCIIGSDRKRFHLAFLDSKKDASICLPSSEARAAARILKEADGHCTILAGERSIEFKAEGISFSGQLAEVRYPDVEVVTKFETKPLATVTATELKTAVRDASGFSHGVLKTISLRFEKSRLLVIGDNNATAIFER